MVTQSQAHSHYHPSDYGSSQEFMAAQQKLNLENMKRADKHVGELDEQIASAMQPLIRHISEAWGKSSDGLNASEEREASEAKINTIQTTMKKEMEESFKKEVAESQQFIKELVGSQMAKLKEALAQENEQKLHSLQKTLAQEGEDRATSLRKTLIQENEKRIAEMKESINREHKAKIAALENALADEAKNKDRIAALEQSLSNEAKNKERIAALENSLSNEAKNKDRIAALEKSLSNEARNKERITALEKSLSEELGNKTRIAALEKSLSEEVRNKERIAALEKSLSEAVRNKDRIGELEKSLSGEVQNKDRIGELEKSLSEQVRNKDRIADLEKSLSEQADYNEKTAELEKTLSEQRAKNSGLQKRVARAEARLDRAEADQKLLIKSLVDPKQLTVIKDQVSRLDVSLRQALSAQRLLSESSISKSQLTEQLQQLSLSQDDKFSKHEARVNDHSTIIKRLEEQICDHSKLITENKPQKDAATRLDKLDSTISNFSAEWEEMKKRVEKLSSIRSASVPDSKILEVIKPELEKLDKFIRGNIEGIQSRLHPFIVQETLKRETLEDQFGNITRQVSGIEKEHAIIKADCSEIREQVNNQNQLNTLEGSRFDEKLDRRTSMLMDRFKSQMEGTAPQIVALKQQLNGIEARLAAWENASNKRRKLPGGNVKVVNGRQIDAQ
ncbi:hypothetical protein H0G86_008416 [Trichoderma simmonsii]|uniref:Uncharacterized protein n=1 Tax=Trichoderma simmonsii TaxID=1491479 RepID=A0A8G0PLX5_9HYPO|nr:hypothetical protein H0G86_008416 [Trichoderma simmonsii]